VPWIFPYLAVKKTVMANLIFGFGYPVLPVENLVKIEVSLCLAVIFRLKVNVLKDFPSSPTKKIQVNVKITLVFTQFSTGEPRKECGWPGVPWT
jgi:hypothetical protein